MQRRSLSLHFRAFTLDPNASEPLHRQLYDEVRDAILTGRLAAGSRLPASRELATVTQLSRNTVLAAFDQLTAEGYIEGRPGSGTYVARTIPEGIHPEAPRPPSQSAGLHAARPLSKMAIRFQDTDPLRSLAKLEADAFRPGLPALDHFPMEVWRRISDRRLRTATTRMLTYDDPQGSLPLRQAIATHLSASRGARCTADHVIIVSGSQQAIDLAARVLLDPGDEVWMEDPGYFAARVVFEMAGARVMPVGVDEAGLMVHEGVSTSPNARLAYVTPSHHNPTCVTMSLARRVELLQWAERAGAWVLEDDNASEYRYSGRPVAALQGIDGHDRTLYFGTFSKVLFSSLRLGYIVAPLDLVPSLVSARESADRQSPGWQQAVLTDFLTEGHFNRHLRRMRVLYAARLRNFTEVATRYAGDILEVPEREGGMSRVAYLLAPIDDQVAASAAHAAGISCVPLSHYRIRPGGRPGLILGFTGMNEDAAARAMQRLAALLRRLRPLPPVVPGTLEAME